VFRDGLYDPINIEGEPLRPHGTPTAYSFTEQLYAYGRELFVLRV
jgi:hypothetical protein